MIITYAIMAVIATALLIGYTAFVRKKEPWLFLLFVCVSIVNIGYFLLSVSKTLEFAIIANDIAYFGSVFLSMCMLLAIRFFCVDYLLTTSCDRIRAFVMRIRYSRGAWRCHPQE